MLQKQLLTAKRLFPTISSPTKTDLDQLLIVEKISKPTFSSHSRTFRSTMEHGPGPGFEKNRLHGRRLLVRHLCRLVHVHHRHSGHDGGAVGLFAHLAFALGGVYEQVLRRFGLPLPAILVQGDPGR
jgi:hypothetical protein